MVFMYGPCVIPFTGPEIGNAKSWQKASALVEFRRSWHEKLTLVDLSDVDVLLF